MLDFYQKRKLRTAANSRVTITVLLAVLAFLAWHAFERYTVADTMAQRRETLEQTATALQERKDALQAEVQYLQDERGIEAQMRRQFDVALPGEEVVVILEDDPPPQVLPLTPTSTDTGSGWWPW